MGSYQSFFLNKNVFYLSKKDSIQVAMYEKFVKNCDTDNDN